MAAALPHSAQTRLDRFAGAHARTSLLTVPAAAGLKAVGFETVGEVMGCVVRRLAGQVYGTCGRVPGNRYGPPPPVRLSSYPRSPYGTYAQTTRQGFTTAVGRLLAEATALGADGVVGVRLVRSRLDDECREFAAFGTAVRARSRTRPRRVFTTDLAGPDFAKLLLGGWVPTALHVGLEVAIRHSDWTVQVQTQRRQGNTEVAGFTEVVQKAKVAARGQLRAAIGKSGADGGLLSRFEVATWDHECDHVAEVLLTGTAIARFGEAIPSSRLVVLPVKS